jgi:hypothetical protein
MRRFVPIVVRASLLVLQVGLMVAGVGIVIAGLASSPAPWLAPITAGCALVAAGLFVDVGES